MFCFYLFEFSGDSVLISKKRKTSNKFQHQSKNLKLKPCQIYVFKLEHFKVKAIKIRQIQSETLRFDTFKIKTFVSKTFLDTT